MPIKQKVRNTKPIFQNINYFNDFLNNNDCKFNKLGSKIKNPKSNNTKKILQEYKQKESSKEVSLNNNSDLTFNYILFNDYLKYDFESYMINEYFLETKPKFKKVKPIVKKNKLTNMYETVNFNNPPKEIIEITLNPYNKILVDNPNTFDEIILKPKKGYIKKLKDLSKLTFKKYTYKVKYLSHKIAKQNNLENYGVKGFELDHKISTWFAYKHEIDYKIISQLNNLQMLNTDINLNKSYMSVVDDSNKHILKNIEVQEHFKNSFLQPNYDVNINYYKILNPNKIDRFRLRREKILNKVSE